MFCPALNITQSSHHSLGVTFPVYCLAAYDFLVSQGPTNVHLIETVPVYTSVSLSGLTTVAGSGRQAGPETWSHCCADAHAAHCCTYSMCKMLVTNKYAICCMDWLVAGTPSQHGCIDCTWRMQMAGHSSSIPEKNRNHALSVLM